MSEKESLVIALLKFQRWCETGGPDLVDQIAALTYRAEQAERERDERQKWRDRWLTKYIELFCTVREVTEDEFMDHFGSEPEHFEALSDAIGMRLDQAKLAAAEAEVKRLREALAKGTANTLRDRIDTYRTTLNQITRTGGPRDFYMEEQVESMEKELDALLAQPSGGKEAGDAQ